MIHAINDFEQMYNHEIESTGKVFANLTDESLSREFSPNLRNLGRLAWHITTTIPEMMGKTGLTIAGPNPEAPVPTSASEIANGYREAASSLIDQIKSGWTDASMEIEDDMYGEKWKRGMTLQGLIHHEIHHRAEMIVLMRLAGLPVPGLYGPTQEEWTQYGMEPPAV